MAYSVTRQEVVDAAMSFRGVRFRHQGRDRNGLDCMGLFAATLEAVNYPNIVDYEGYRKSPPASLVYETLKANFDEIDVTDAKPGDIFLLRPPGSQKAKHGAMLVSDITDPSTGRVPAMIHAYATSGVVIDNLSSWRNRIVTAFRLRGIID